jgi:hypothetical protein
MTPKETKATALADVLFQALALPLAAFDGKAGDRLRDALATALGSLDSARLDDAVDALLTLDASGAVDAVLGKLTGTSGRSYSILADALSTPQGIRLIAGFEEGGAG